MREYHYRGKHFCDSMCSCMCVLVGVVPQDQHTEALVEGDANAPAPHQGVS